MDAIWTTAIAAAASLLGVGIGAFTSHASDSRRTADILKERRIVDADAVVDALVAAITALRRLPDPHYEDLVLESYLPKQWYETHWPQLLRIIGKIDDPAARNALRDVASHLGDTDTHGTPQSTYAYVDAQLMLALNISQSYRRGEPMSEQDATEIEQLRERRASTGPF